ELSRQPITFLSNFATLYLRRFLKVAIWHAHPASRRKSLDFCSKCKSCKSCLISVTRSNEPGDSGRLGSSNCELLFSRQSPTCRRLRGVGEGCRRRTPGLNRVSLAQLHPKRNAIMDGPLRPAPPPRRPLLDRQCAREGDQLRV